MNKIKIPLSRFRRELNKWVRYIKNNQEDVIYITQNNKIFGVILSPNRYNTIINLINNYESYRSKKTSQN